MFIHLIQIILKQVKNYFTENNEITLDHKNYIENRVT